MLIRRIAGAALLAASIGTGWFERQAIEGHAIAAVYGGDYRGQTGVVRQRGMRDCGVAALAMMLDAHGLPENGLAALRDSVAHRGRGLSLLELQRASRMHGLALTGYRLTFDGLANRPLPLIAHVLHHYVVVDSLMGDSLVLRDPVGGRIATTRTGFTRVWTGYTLVASSDTVQR